MAPLAKGTGPTAQRTYTFPDADATILTSATASFANGTLLVGNGTNVLTALATGAAGTVLVGGSTFSADPAVASLTAPTLVGGTGTTSTLTLKPTTGAGTTGADIIFGVGNNGGTEAARILNSGNVGIGTAAPSSRLHIVGTNAAAGVAARRIQNNANGPVFALTKSRGAVGAETTVTTNDETGTFQFFGYDGSGDSLAGQIRGFVDAAVSTGIVPGRLTFFTTTTGGASTERIRINNAGNVGMGTGFDPLSKLHIEGASGWIIQDEQDTNPTTTELDANDAIAIYNKANKFVIAFNNAGTITYVSIPLDGSTTTWTQSTTAP